MRKLLVALAVISLSACSNPPVEQTNASSGSGAGATGSSGATSGSGTTTTGATSGSSGATTGSTGSSGNTGTATPYVGYVLFNYLHTGFGGGFGDQHAVTAGFAPANSMAAQALDPAHCADGVMDSNNCCYRSGRGLGDAGLSPDSGFDFDGGFTNDGGFAFDAGAFDAGPQVTAGVLNLTADNVAIGQMSPMNGYYAPYTSATWNAGQLLGVQASGAEFPAFSASALAPTTASITSPAVGGFNAPTVDTSAALVVTWTGSGDKAEVILANASFSKTLTCYGDNNGQRTISSATLSMYFASESGNYGILAVAPANVSVVDAGINQVTVAADTAAGGFIKFQ